jgi:hypothetical protein
MDEKEGHNGQAHHDGGEAESPAIGVHDVDQQTGEE